MKVCSISSKICGIVEEKKTHSNALTNTDQKNYITITKNNIYIMKENYTEQKYVKHVIIVAVYVFMTCI